jgi:DNA polymerase III subunit alpha
VYHLEGTLSQELKNLLEFSLCPLHLTTHLVYSLLKGLPLPTELATDRIAATGAISTLETAERIGQRVTVAGVRQTSHRRRTAKGEPMLFLSLEDLSGMLDVVFFPNAYRQAKNVVSSSIPFLVSGTMEMDVSRGEPLLKAEKVVALD